MGKTRRILPGAAIAATAILFFGGAVPATAAPTGVESLPPISYVDQSFSGLSPWTVDRTEPSIFAPGDEDLVTGVDRATAAPGAHERTEGEKAAIPSQVTVAPGDVRDVISVAADLYIDPAWQGLPTSVDNAGLQTSFSFGMWVDVLYHPYYGSTSAHPSVMVASRDGGGPMATILDTTGYVAAADSPEVPVNYGDTVTLEIRYNAADYSYYYFVDDTLIFAHQWWQVEEEGYVWPMNHLYFQAYNTGQLGTGDGEAASLNPVTATWSNLRFGVLASPATLVTETLPGGTAGSAWGPVALEVASEAGYTTSVTAGSLPPGLALSPEGVLSGTPTTPGTYTFTVFADNGAEPREGVVSSREYTITIAPAEAGGGGDGGEEDGKTEELANTGGSGPALLAGAAGLALAAAGALLLMRRRLTLRHPA
jgi:LPXTG-motif cell wall-anchored protein